LSELFLVDFEPEVKQVDMAEVEEKVLVMLQAAQVDREVNLLVCSPATIQELNQSYRGKDKPTDILSFGYELPEEPLGDLALCLEVAERQAGEFDLSLTEELLRLLAHGLVHLLGYDHQTEAEEAQMLAKEIELLKTISLSHLYPEPTQGPKRD